MSVLTRWGAVSLLMSLLIAAPAMAEGSAGGTSWSDPPARGAENPAPTNAADGNPKTGTPVKQTAPASAPITATPAERAARELGVKPVDSAKRTARAATIHTQRTMVRPRMVERPMVITRRRVRLTERARQRPPAQRITKRTARAYAADSRGIPSSWSRRRLADWRGLTEENRAGRIAGERAPGDRFTSMRTDESPGEIRFPGLRPFGFDDPGDAD